MRKDVPIKSINTKERIREDFGDIEDLAKSIEVHGLLHPVVLHEIGEERYELIAGERRFRALRFLKWETIPATVFKDKSDLQAKAMEIEENIKRKDFTWAERAKGTKELEEIKQAIFGKAQPGKRGQGDEKRGFGRKDTAELLGKSVGAVTQDIELAEAVNMWPELEYEESPNVALKKARAIKEAILLRALAKLETPSVSETEEFFNLDCLDWLEERDSDSIDCIITDPPWGIALEKSFRSKTSGRTGGEFKDDEAFAFLLMAAVIPQLYRVLKNDRQMYFFFGMQYYARIKLMLEAAGCQSSCKWSHAGPEKICSSCQDKKGFEVPHNPLIWFKGCPTAAPTGNFWASSYETIFYCRKGDRKLLRSGELSVQQFNTLGSSVRIHPTEKPVKLLQVIIRNATHENELLLDPFAGSFSLHRACFLSDRRCISIEKDKTFFLRGLESIRDARHRLSSTTDVDRKDPPLHEFGEDRNCWSCGGSGWGPKDSDDDGYSQCQVCNGKGKIEELTNDQSMQNV